ncbi:putative metal-nicotianamine transporter YSL3-like isoform [Sesbania bispinosa]|nr:putative metal-nicotianamine transporter YSL3-like isoform [Sesbania bispinosa]
MQSFGGGTVVSCNAGGGCAVPSCVGGWRSLPTVVVFPLLVNFRTPMCVGAYLVHGYL